MRRALGLLLCCSLAQVAPARAQTLGDTLREHVREGIDDSEEKARKQREEEERKKKQAEKDEPPPPKREPKPEPAKPPEGGSSVVVEFGSGGDPLAQQEEPEKPKLPLRVFGKPFQLDVTLGGGYRGWLPQQYDAVSVNVGNYATWNIDVKAKIYMVALRRGYYESNGVNAPRTNEGAVASQVAKYAPKAVRLLGVLGVPFGAWEPQVRYESHAFETSATPSQKVCVVPRDVGASFDPKTCMGTKNELRILSAFETLVAGVRYDHSKADSPVVGNKVGKIPPIFFGIGLMQYRKPYQVNVGSVTASEFLFDGRFRGAGLALGTNLGGGVNNVFVDVDAQLGAGQVSLTDHLTLNSLVPSGYTIGYVQGTANLGYRLALFAGPPTLMLVPVVGLGGASFFLVSTSGDNKDSTSPSVNWDFLWNAQISLLLPL